MATGMNCCTASSIDSLYLRDRPCMPPAQKTNPRTEMNMKILTALTFAGMILVNQASAACTNIRETYRSTVAANSDAIALGPFVISGNNGCRQANISSTISAVGPGTAPTIFIDRLIGSIWTEVARSRGNSASVLGPLGTYRIRHVNSLSVDRQYSGTTSYSR